MRNYLLSLALAFFATASFGNEAAPAANANTQTTKEIVLSASNTILLDNYVFSGSVAQVMKTALELDAKLMPGAPIYLVLYTGGGSIQAGLEMINLLKSIDRPVNTISVFAASMGFQTVQGLGKRYILQDGTLMSHMAYSSGFGGTFPNGNLESRYKRYSQRILDLNARTVARTNGKWTNDSYEKLIHDEYWCDGQHCVDDGFADEVVSGTCDSSLNGIRKKVIGRRLIRKEANFGDAPLAFYVVEFVLEKSKCPFVTGTFGTNIYIDDKPLFKLNSDAGADANRNAINTGDKLLDSNIKNMIDELYSEDGEITLMNRLFEKTPAKDLKVNFK